MRSDEHAYDHGEASQHTWREATSRLAWGGVSKGSVHRTPAGGGPSVERVDTSSPTLFR
jgi:hypothetical protein